LPELLRTGGGEMRRGPFTFSRNRVIQVLLMIVPGIVGAALHYFTLGYTNFSSEPVRETVSLWPAARLTTVLSLGYLPATSGTPDQLQHGLDFINLGGHCHEVGLVVAVLSCWGLFMDEINKFVWWPLHISGWLLVLGTAATIGGWAIWRGLGVDVHLGPGWIPLSASGILIIVFTFLAWSRVDRSRGL
jgi:hypothetical protein